MREKICVKTLGSILTSSTRGHITSTAVWMRVIVAFLCYGQFTWFRAHSSSRDSVIYLVYLVGKHDKRISVLLNIIVNLYNTYTTDRLRLVNKIFIYFKHLTKCLPQTEKFLSE